MDARGTTASMSVQLTIDTPLPLLARSFGIVFIHSNTVQVELGYNMYDAIKETSGQSDIDKSTVLFICEMIDVLRVGYGYIYVGPRLFG